MSAKDLWYVSFMLNILFLIIKIYMHGININSIGMPSIP